MPERAGKKVSTKIAVLRIKRKEMLRVIECERTFAASFLDCLLGRISRCQDLVVDHLFDCAEKRLARTLLLLANFGANGETEAVVPYISQNELAKVVGTTRSRTSSFMPYPGTLDRVW